ncbi:MAG: AAA family ATPase, partial [Actinobacteria bacterium]|nr:AAA family ATPase [Actinomycetota bacterium]
MPQLILQPAGNAGGRSHFADTVANPVPVESIRAFIHADDADRLQEHADSVPVWGVTPGTTGTNARKWERIDVGDLSLFMREGRAIAAGLVHLKIHAPALADHLWGRDERGQTWEHVYFLSPTWTIDVAYEPVNDAIGYASDYRHQAFNVLGETEAERVLGLSSFAEIARTAEARRGQRVWWVNQGQAYRAQRDAGFVWAPKRTKAGSANRYHLDVLRLRPNDLIVHYADGARAIGTVEGRPVLQERPASLNAHDWGNDGYLARVRYEELDPVVDINDIPIQWRRDEAGAGSEIPAFNRDGAVKLGYLFELTRGFWERLMTIAVPDGSPSPVPASSLGKVVQEFADGLRGANLRFTDELITRFVAAALTKPFVILTGLSGSGKTKLAQALACWLGCAADRGTLALVAVGADWTASDKILGYPDALDPSNYVRTPVLELLMHAREHPREPHVLILDEMNLSHVERYFADVLSAIESGEDLHLHVAPGERAGIPPRLPWPRNVLVIGTVNVDETTYMFSPKVLDRANVIEFRPGAEELRRFVRDPAVPSLNLLSDLGVEFREHFTSPAAGTPRAELLRPLERELALFFDVLEMHGWEFGFRTASDVVRFASAFDGVCGGRGDIGAIIDAQVVQKLLPRLNG